MVEKGGNADDLVAVGGLGKRGLHRREETMGAVVLTDVVVAV